MPLDNTDDFFKNKLAELDQTLPPEITWNKTQGWQQLQPTLPAKRRQNTIWYQVAAAVAILISGLFLLNPKVKTPQTTAVNQNLKLTHPGQPVAKQPARFQVKNTVVMVVNKAQIPKNLKKQLKFATKINQPASVQNSELAQNTSLILNAPEVPLDTSSETIPPVQTPVRITVVLGGKTNRQVAVYAAHEVAKVNRKKSNWLKVQVNLPGEMHPNDSVFAASTSLLPDRSALSAKIDL